MNNKNLFPVGTYSPILNKLLNISLPAGIIYQSGGLYKHIFRKHPDCLKYLNSIPDIIKRPDYIGVNPKEPESVEFVKKLDSHILLGVKLDKNENYLFVASVYEISDSKVERRLHSGRLKPTNNIDFNL